MDKLNLRANFAFGVLLKRRNLSQQEAARAMGISECSLSRLLNFRRKLIFSELLEFSKKYSLALDELTEIIKQLEKNPELEREIAEVVDLRQVTHKRQAALT